jgi:nicotinamide-nucleotide amidase
MTASPEPKPSHAAQATTHPATTHPSAALPAPPAFILTIGDELLVGDRADLNGPWLASRLTGMGFEVVELRSVGDDFAALSHALREAQHRASYGVVVITGGLGPTLDDRTREALARLYGVPLDEDEGIIAALEARALARGLSGLAATNRRIAQVPRGAVQLRNPVGTAPGLELAIGQGAHVRDDPSARGGDPSAPGPDPSAPGPDPSARGGDPSVSGGSGVMVALPGVPREMQAIFEAEVRMRLEARFGARLSPPSVFSVRTAGIVESQLAQELEAVVPETGGIRIAYRPSLEGVEVRISVDPAGVPSGSTPASVLARALAEARPILEPWRIEGGDGSLEGALLHALEARGLRLAVAESCTGGRVLERLTSVSGSSRVLIGGFVAYANELKQMALGINSATLLTQGAVSEAVAGEMALGAARVTGAQVAIAITGIAGPSGGTPEKPVGTVCFGFRGPDGTVVTERKFLPGGREEVRVRATAHALFRTLRMVEGEARGWDLS